MKISAVITTYNRPDSLGRLLSRPETQRVLRKVGWQSDYQRQRDGRVRSFWRPLGDQKKEGGEAGHQVGGQSGALADKAGADGTKGGAR